jgi:hypothetical protein
VQIRRLLRSINVPWYLLSCLELTICVPLSINTARVWTGTGRRTSMGRCLFGEFSQSVCVCTASCMQHKCSTVAYATAIWHTQQEVKYSITLPCALSALVCCLCLHSCDLLCLYMCTHMPVLPHVCADRAISLSPQDADLHAYKALALFK